MRDNPEGGEFLQKVASGRFTVLKIVLYYFSYLWSVHPTQYYFNECFELANKLY